jgi:thiamine-phosphate pyrophosphorylase
VRLLYVTDRAAIGEARFEHVLDALSGASGLLVQLREKSETDRNLVDLAKSVREKLGGSVPLFVNRRFDVALAAGADGVHLPADGLPVSRVRAGSPRGFRIGVSTHSVAEAHGSAQASVDTCSSSRISGSRPSSCACGPLA